MLVRIGAALSISTQYIHRRGSTFQFRIRVPKDLVRHYGKPDIRKTLGTSDFNTAIKMAEAEAQRYKAEFKLLSEGKASTPKDVSRELDNALKNYNLETYIDAVLNPARAKFAKGDDWVYENAEPSQFLSPVQMQAWERLSSPDVIRLSDALIIYLKHHQRGADKAFSTKISRDWNALINFTGDIQFAEFSRKHANDFTSFLTAKGHKTGTVRKTLNILRAVMGSAITELELTKANPFKALKIQGEGNDTEKAAIATPGLLQEIAKTLSGDVTPVALIILLQMELGSRIGEVAGLGLDDVFLDEPIPYIFFRPKPWRTLKNRDSERKVPVIGIALEAVRAAVALPRTNSGLFSTYAKARGNDSASAAVNKRLARWGLTTHSFRHTMTDRLRDAGCPKDIRDAIQGHARADIAETYGQGYSLQMMQQWLSKVAVICGSSDLIGQDGSDYGLRS